MIYLDNAAIQKPKQECIDAAVGVWKNHWGNASSTYEFGLESRRIVEETRETIAKEINCKPNEIIFCSSGSEANALAIDGFKIYEDIYKTMDHIVNCTPVEHPSILNNIRVISDICVNLNGVVNVGEYFDNNIYSIQLANSEIGTIQDIKSIAKEIHNNNGYIHTDATQAFGHIKIDVKNLNVDALTATGQKLGSIPGAAFLYIREELQQYYSPIIHGNQENGLRGGTYNVGAIASLGRSVELIDYSKQDKIKDVRNNLLDMIYSECKDVCNIYLNGTPDWNKRLPNNLSLTFNGINAESLITLLSMKDVMISAGSACCAGSKKPSKVLKAIGLSDEECFSTVRITLGEDTTIDECKDFVLRLKDCLIILNRLN